uniref:Major facilitator superfamily (MFS) profile domain-containing protein n=1 Tax=Aegilops tauschii subsp. strangulata TaxID=200361 RepID=A0A453PT63_AEGTS
MWYSHHLLTLFSKPWGSFRQFQLALTPALATEQVPVFIAEIAPKALRGGLTALNPLMIGTGLSVTYIVGTVVSWRMLAMAGLAPCIILIAGLFFIPESPRWLAKVGRQKEFEIALQRLRGRDADVSLEAAEIKDFIETIDKLPKAGIQDLFSRSYIGPVIIGAGLMVFQQFAGINGILFYASETFVSAGFDSGNLGTILMACIQVKLIARRSISIKFLSNFLTSCNLHYNSYHSQHLELY